ncbi:restriction endonuclease subunit S [Pasteurellaceae bacterium TAE3-ERU1]|nr:restriction endonuclease subunit S [Pasteurellaceae bacterium TAE3-ERU1]
MSDWQVKKLKDLGMITTGKTPPSRIEDAFSKLNKSIPFVTPTDMRGDRYITETERYLTADGLDSVRNSYIQENSIIVSCIGSDMGKAAIVNQGVVTNQQINSITVKKEFNYKYIYYVLSTKQQELKSIAGGSATPILNKTHFSNFEINLPNREYQDFVVNTLDPIDQKIQLNTDTNRTLEQIAQAVFQHWFIDFAPVHAKAQARAQGKSAVDIERAAMMSLSGKTADELTALATCNPTAYTDLQTLAAAFPDELTTTEHGEVPKGWEIVPLSQICAMKNGYAFKSKEWTDQGIPVIKIGSIKPMIVDVESNGYVDPNNELLRPDFLVQSGDILVGLTGYVGEVGRIPYAKKAMLNQRVGLFKPKKINQEKTYYNCVYCLARQPEFKAYAETNAKGSAQANISTKEILNYPIFLASKDVHLAFENLISAMLDKILFNAYENELLAKARDELLPRFLSGEIL